MSNPTELPDLDRLEALARAATPVETDLYGDRYFQGPYSQANFTQEQDEFFRAASPAAVLSLIALARRAQPEGEVWELLNELYRLNPTPEAQALIQKIDRKFELVAAAIGKPESEAPQAELSRVKQEIRKVLKHHGLTKVGDGVVEADLAAVLAKFDTAPAAQQAESGAQAAVKTWKDRMSRDEVKLGRARYLAEDYMREEIADLRAALAAQPQGSPAPTELTPWHKRLNKIGQFVTDDRVYSGESAAIIAREAEIIDLRNALARQSQSAQAADPIPSTSPRKPGDWNVSDIYPSDPSDQLESRIRAVLERAGPMESREATIQELVRELSK